MNDALVTLRQKSPALSTSELRVAEAVLHDPDIVVTSTITQLATRCGTSPGTVARLCRAVGYSGYKEFRIAIASAVGREQENQASFQVSDARIGAGDSAAEVIAKVAYQESRAIEETARLIDVEALDAVVEALTSARRVDIFGAGSSGLAAQDLQVKLHRIGIPSICWSDAHLALTSVAITAPDSLALAISHSGTTRECVEFLELAQDRRATTAAITGFPESPVADHADHVLATATHDSGVRAGAMSSRIAQMAVIDFILVRLVQRDMGGADSRLRASYSAVQGHRIKY